MDGDGGEKKDVRRPMNAFLIFCKRHRSVVRQKNPDMDNRSVTRLLGDLWANLGEEKSTYTNLAKQYKDAFMKAHPNYKWHSNEKSHVSSAKLPVKPTNALVMKSVADLSQEGGITPGKLADLDKMGGLNLLLMADKETSHEVRASSSLATAPQSTTQQSNNNKSDQSGSSNNALLQLAEMCSSELHSSSDRQGPSSSSAHLQNSHSQQLATSKVSNSVAPSIMLSSLNPSSHQPMPPPKKRARHWSLTETENSAESPASNLTNENKLHNCQSKTDLSPLNLSIYSQRLLPLSQSEDRYSSVEKYKVGSPRRRLSSSATESIPSPSPPYVDGAESPVFATETSDNQAFFNLSTFSASRDLNSIVATKTATTPESLESHRAHPLGSINAGTQSQTQLQLVSVEASKAMPNPEAIGRQQSFSHDSLHPSNPQLLTDVQFKVDIKMEKNNPDFYQWREPSKTKSQTLESPLIGRSQIEDAVPRNRPKPVSVVGETFSKMNNGSPIHTLFTEEQQSYPRNEAANDIRQAPLSSKLLLQSIKFEHELKPTIQGKVGLTSSSCEGKKSTIVNGPDTSSPKLTLSSNNGSSSGCGLFQQFESLKKLTMNLGTSVSPKLRDLYEPALRLPITPTNTNTFSEGKLKKKWAERMLVEAKLEEDHTQRQILAQEIERNAQASGDSQSSSFKNRNPMTGQIHASDAKFPFSNKTVETNRNDKAGHAHSLKSAPVQNESQNAVGQHGRLILNQPLDAVKSYQSQNPSFSASSHPKLMLQLSQGQSPQQYRPGQIWHQRYWNDVKIKHGLDATNGPDEQKLLSFALNSEVPNKSQSNHDNKPILKPIAACGKKIYDHIVQQLCKSDFSGDKISENTQPCLRNDSHNQDTIIRPDDIKVEKQEVWLQPDERKDCRPLTASSLVEKVVREVCGSPPGKDGCTSCRKSEGSSICVPFMESIQQSPCSSNIPVKQNGNEIVSPQNHVAWQTYRQTPPSPTNDNINQWPTHPIESGDRSDHEDTSVPPVRKSRRANRGQKYQELIKEGFIQPSRERLAARNAERNGRSFGTRDEYEKMECKRTLKRSASERDASLIDISAINSNVHSAITKCGNEVVPSDDKRFRNGGFDLEREIESLPVCSIDQMEKKKSLRRRCDSETLSRTRNVNENDIELSNPSPCKASPAVCSLKYQDSGCPAPHIPIPKENRPSEPLTGSRKRKARNYCITRISMQAEPAYRKEQSIQETDKKKAVVGESVVISSASDTDKSDYLPVKAKSPGADKGDGSAILCEEVSSKTHSFESKQHTISIHEQQGTKSEVVSHHSESLTKPLCFGSNQLPILAPTFAEAASLDTAVATSALLVLSSFKQHFTADPAIKSALSLNRSSPTSFSSLWNIGRSNTTRLVNQGSTELSCPSVAKSSPMLSTAKFSNLTERTNSNDTQAFLVSSFKPIPAEVRKLSKSDPMQNHFKLTPQKQNNLKALQILRNLDASVNKKDKKEPNSSPAMGKVRRGNTSRSKQRNESVQQDKKCIELMRPEVDINAGGSSHVPFSKTNLVTTLQCTSEVRCHEKLQTLSKSQDKTNNHIFQLASLKSPSLDGQNTFLSNHMASSSAGVTEKVQGSGIKTNSSSSVEPTSGAFCTQQPFKSELMSALGTHMGLIQTLMSKTATPSKSEAALSVLCSESKLQLPATNSTPGTVRTILQQDVASADSTMVCPAAASSCSQVILTAQQIFEHSSSFSQMKQNSPSTQNLSKTSSDPVTLISSSDNPSVHTSYAFVCHDTTCSTPTSDSCVTSPPSSGNGFSTSSSLFSVSPASSVISKTTSAPSNLNEIVSYSVIGSSAVIESGSPHMVGSPHLPESPSVAVVQS